MVHVQSWKNGLVHKTYYSVYGKHCQCVTSLLPQVTYTGKLGASREKAQALLGAFYGIPLMSTSPHRSATTPSKPATLHPLEQQLLSEYCSAREKLTASLIASPAHSEEHTTLPKHSQDSVRERYRACFLAQTRLARLRHYMHTVGSEGGAPVIGGVFSVEEAAAEVDLTCLSLSQLYRLSGCLVNILLVLCGPREGELASRPAFTGESTVSGVLLLVL